MGCRPHPGAPVRPRGGPVRDHRDHSDDLGGDTHQPAPVDRRHRRDRRNWSRCGGNGPGGQHLCLTGIATTVDPGGRHRVALDDEIHRRAFRCGGRCADHRQRGTRCQVRVPAERRRRRAGPLRCLPDDAGSEDTRVADATALRQRRSGRSVPRRASGREPGALSGPGRTSRPRSGGTPDARIRRNGLGAYAWWR